MYQKHDLNIEQRHLNDTYRKLNSSVHTSYYKEENHSESPSSYWSFLKLRIGFSILLLFFIIGCSKSFHTSELKKVSTVFSHINETDPYTQKILDQLEL